MNAVRLKTVTDAFQPASSRGRATRQKLIVAAEEVFAERGFVDARISHITSAAGVAYGSFYTYFASKDAIFYEVADQLFTEMFASDPAEADDSGSTPGVRLTEANRTFWNRYLSHAPLMAIVEQVATIDPKFQQLRRSHREQTTTRTARSIRRWQELGLVADDIDPYVAAQALGAMVDRTLYLRYVLGERPEPDVALDTINHLTLRALGLAEPTQTN